MIKSIKRGNDMAHGQAFPTRTLRKINTTRDTAGRDEACDWCGYPFDQNTPIMRNEDGASLCGIWCAAAYHRRSREMDTLTTPAPFNPPRVH